jgi:hypothetical protein
LLLLFLLIVVMSELEHTPSPTSTLSSKDSITFAILGFLSRLSLATLQWLGLVIGSMAAWFPHGPCMGYSA